jgi:hypothetical protein
MFNLSTNNNKDIYSGNAGKYILIQTKIQCDSEWQLLHDQILANGFKHLGIIGMSFAPGVVLSAFSKNGSIFTIMGNSALPTLQILEYDIYTELNNNKSLTTTSGDNIMINEKKGVFKESCGKVTVKELIDKHISSLVKYGTPAGLSVETILDVAKSIDRFIVRQFS